MIGDQIQINLYDKVKSLIDGKEYIVHGIFSNGEVWIAVRPYLVLKYGQYELMMVEQDGSNKL